MSHISSHGGSDMAESRKKQGKRDEAIRKKIEAELNRKRPTPKRPVGGNSNRRSKPASSRQGTVSALRPLPALTVPQSISVADASQLCAAKRTDCVLVVDEDEHLCGIFTAKDLAFRVVGDGLDPRTTPVSAIMTKNPMVTRDTTSATEALQTMVSRGFRHLPVCNEEGDVVGLLDITKVFHESLEKLERAYGSSQKLYSALEGVQSEWGGSTGMSGQANGLMSYVEALREKMSFPDLGSILDARTQPVTVSVKTSVRDAARLMREHHTTAVCVMEAEGRKIAGIFTSKDVVLRVIAAGLDSKTCSVVRVMTPHPDVGSPALSIQEALRKMHDGRYLNLPVVEEDGKLVGCVDVLKLTYATLEQINAIGADQGIDAAGGPLWSKFFSSFAGNSQDGETESVVSEGPNETGSAAPVTPMPERLRSKQYSDSPASEVHPNDSASVVDETLSEIGRKLAPPSAVSGNTPISPVADDGTYLFKFVAPGGTIHRFQARYEEGYDLLRDIISGKLATDPFFNNGDESDARPSPTDFKIFYLDDDGDTVMASQNTDIVDAVKVAKKAGKDRVVLTLRGGKGWENENAKAVITDKTPVLDAPPSNPDLIFGLIPKDLALPAAIAFLGVAVIGCFALTKTTK